MFSDKHRSIYDRQPTATSYQTKDEIISFYYLTGVVAISWPFINLYENTSTKITEHMPSMSMIRIAIQRGSHCSIHLPI